jgi:hypothetical protein
MIRRFNYTGKQRIRREDVSIRLTTSKPVRSFEAQLLLGEYGLPGDAKVFIEAYEKTAVMRFPFGAVGSTSPPAGEKLKLTEFEGSEAVRFRVKVVDSGGRAGRLLAEAEGIHPVFPEEKDEKRRPLLPVRYEVLGEQVWKVEFPESTQDNPILLVNVKIPDKTALVRSPLFVSLVLPAVLREILNQILLVEEYQELEDGSDWKSLWLRFAKRLAGGDPPGEGQDPAEWVDAAVAAFCDKQKAHTRYAETQQEQS